MEEMNCAPNPQWLKDFKNEIQEKYNLTLLDAACIAGMVAKIIRKRDDKACEWLERYMESLGYIDEWCRKEDEFIKTMGD